MLSQNIPLWHKDCFDLEALEKQQTIPPPTQKNKTKKSPIWISFFFLKAGDEIPLWKMSSLYLKESDIFIIKGKKLKRILHKQNLLK